jgi:magnesium-protoporphyrin O-methyltransferase
MACCAYCHAIEGQFTRRTAEGDRRRYRRRGPDPTTAQLLALLSGLDPRGSTLLDIGGGIGVIPLELLAGGARSATLIEASAAYLDAARAEAAAAGQDGRLQFFHGDFVALAGDVPDADLVTLDRVVCCYPDHHALLATSAGKCRRAFALSYPRDRWHVRAVVRLQNLVRRLLGNSFRTFVHPDTEIHRALTEAGLRLAEARDGLVWRAALYVRG